MRKFVQDRLIFFSSVMNLADCVSVRGLSDVGMTSDFFSRQ